MLNFVFDSGRNGIHSFEAKSFGTRVPPVHGP